MPVVGEDLEQVLQSVEQKLAELKEVFHDWRQENLHQFENVMRCIDGGPGLRHRISLNNLAPPRANEAFCSSESIGPAFSLPGSQPLSPPASPGLHEDEPSDDRGRASGESLLSLRELAPASGEGSHISPHKTYEAPMGGKKQAKKRSQTSDGEPKQGLKRIVDDNCDAEAWVQSVLSRKQSQVRQRHSVFSSKSAVSEMKPSHGKTHKNRPATVQDLEAAFVDMVIQPKKSRTSGRQALLSPVLPSPRAEPSPPCSPNAALPDQLGRSQSPPGGELSRDTKRPYRIATNNSQEMEKLHAMSNRAATAILEKAFDAENGANSLLQQDLGCKISVNIPNALLGLITICSIAAFGIDIALEISLDRVDVDSLTVIGNAIFSLAAVLSCYFLRDALRSADLDLTVNKLHTFIEDFREEWKNCSQLEQRRSLAFWFLWVLIFIAGQVVREWMLNEQSTNHEARYWRYTLHGIAWASWLVSSFLVVLEAYIQSHLLMGLDASLDCWCRLLLDTPDFQVGVESWNCLQALLKCISRKMANSFLVMQMLGGIACIYCLASTVVVAFVSNFAWKVILAEGAFLLPVLMLFFLEMRVLYRGTAITEKCRIVPAFVNQIPSDSPINHERAYLVQFIESSSAGFFIREVKLTREMLLKNFMITGGMFSALIGIMSRV
ncbi:Uncharacterized protein SCF082_LOCUS53408 [Durusdinium trenchii]|uniref:Uncharacterized protein n=1 Tax=Durusdinium trenchii TaxID=1381693 RepID=A0ABP0SSL5_9DINO